MQDKLNSFLDPTLHFDLDTQLKIPVPKRVVDIKSEPAPAPAEAAQP
jgi:hypothetical protein